MTFAQIIRSSPDVRESFARNRMIYIWWVCILRLHGKPVNDLNSATRQSTLANGFQFYGRLYGFVAVAFFIAAIISILTQRDLAFGSSIPLMMAAIYLAAVSQIAIAAAQRYEDDTVEASGSLITFFVGVMVFAACFIGSTATIAVSAFPEQAVLISFIAGGTLTLGVGSYLLEILFLFFDAVRSQSA